jgi:hypothetical protein
MSHTVQAVAARLSHQQTADLKSARQTRTPSPTAPLDTSVLTVHRFDGEEADRILLTHSASGRRLKIKIIRV